MQTQPSERNPYIVGSPIRKKEQFFGRERLIKTLEDELIKNETQIILLRGQRRIGKSSMLQLLPDLIQKNGFAFVYFDLQNKASSSLYRILDELCQIIRETLDLSSPFELPNWEKEDHINIETFVRFIDKILEASNHTNLVILLDEFDILEERDSIQIQQYGGDFYFFLYRALNQFSRLILIPAIGRKSDDENNLKTILKDSVTHKIGCLDRNNTEDLIKKTLKRNTLIEYDPEAIKSIYELSQGHPYFTQVICYSLFSQARESKDWVISEKKVSDSLENVFEAGTGGLDWFWKGLSDMEKIIFSAAAESQEKTKNNYIRNPIHFLEEDCMLRIQSEPKLLSELTKALDNLYVNDYISTGRVQTSNKIIVEVVRQWLLKEHSIASEILLLEKFNSDAQQIYADFASYQYQLEKLAIPSNPKQEQEVLQKAIQFNPNHLNALIRLGLSYLQTEDFQKAIETLERAAKMSPRFAQAQYIQALIIYGKKLLNDGKNTEAKKTFDKVIELEKDNEEAVAGLNEAVARLSKVRVDQIRNQIGGVVVASIGLLFTGILVGRFSIQVNCPSGFVKQGTVCIPTEPASTNTEKISRGEKILFDENKSNSNFMKGVEAMANKDYKTAEEQFKQIKNNPEALIYLNNARANRQQVPPITLAVVVPVSRKDDLNISDVANEILRGIAPSQDKFNNKEGGFYGRFLEIVLADDGNDPDRAKQIATQLAKDGKVLGVIGHNATAATQEAIGIYQEYGLPVISPTSSGDSLSLSNNVFFRTTLPNKVMAQKLADYGKKFNNIAVFYNSNDFYSSNLYAEFTNLLQCHNPNIKIKSNDLKSSALNIENEIKSPSLEAIVLLPNTHRDIIDKALEIAEANYNLNKLPIPMLGGDSFYKPETIKQKKAVEGLIISVPWFRDLPEAIDFIPIMDDYWGNTYVSWRTGLSYDASQAFREAIQKSNSPDRKSVLENLSTVNLSPEKTSGFPLSFDSDGERQGAEAVLIQVKNGNFELYNPSN